MRQELTPKSDTSGGHSWRLVAVNLLEELELQTVNFHCSVCVDIKISVVDDTEESCSS